MNSKCQSDDLLDIFSKYFFPYKINFFEITLHALIMSKNEYWNVSPNIGGLLITAIFIENWAPPYTDLYTGWHREKFVYIYVAYGWTDWAEILCGQSWVAGGIG